MQKEIGRIIIYPPTRAQSLTIRQQYTAEDKTGRTVLDNIYKPVDCAIDEYIAETRSAQTNGADNIPIQDIVTVAIKELDRIKGLNPDSFRYDYAEIGNTPRFTLYWDNGEEPHGEPDADAGNQETLKPWEKIPENRWDQLALRMWWEGFTCPEIAVKQGTVTKERVTNRICELRKLHGVEIVPTDKQRRKMKLGIP